MPATLSLLLLAACAPDEASEAEPESPSVRRDSAGPAVELTIVVSEGQGVPDRRWRLTCEPAGGTHPDPKAACAVLDKLGRRALAPVPPQMSCTMIFGGPERAKLVGTWDGEQVDAQYRRNNGCEIARWKRIQPLLPAVRTPEPVS